MISTATDALPPDLGRRFRELVDRPGDTTLSSLLEEVRDRLRKVELVAGDPRVGNALDAPNARLAGDILTRLLTAQLRADHSAVAAAAARYFLDPDDAISDSAPDGYKDDLLVARAADWVIKSTGSTGG